MSPEAQQLTFAITRTRDEGDIIESSLRRMLRQVDHIIVGDNSADGARELIEGLIAQGQPITLLDDQAKSVEQREVMTSYARMAAEMGAEWVVPYDTDEVWYSPEGRLGDVLGTLPDHVLLAHATLYTHCVTSEDDPEDPDAFSRMKWRSVAALPLPKVACRTRPDLEIGHGNHSACFSTLPRVPAGSEVSIIRAAHFPYRSPEQFIKRVKIGWPMLRDSGLPESHGAHMWAYGRHLDEFGEEGLRQWFMNGMFFTDPQSNPDLVFDPCP